MQKNRLISKIRYHWYSYVARGGYSKPSPKVGTLDKGGVEHWTYFLQLGRKYTSLHKDKWGALSKFLPNGVIMLLTGETLHEFHRRKRIGHIFSK